MNSKLCKQYFRYLATSNKRLIILVWAVMFVGIPFFNGLLITNGGATFESMKDATDTMTMLLAIVTSILAPLCLYRFLYWKKSCDLYFSLPITRKELFLTTSLFGIVVAIVPASVFYMITSMPIARFYDMNPFSLHNILIPLLLIWFYTICTQVVITFIVVRCNHILDAICLAGSYLVVPLILYAALITFASNQISQILVAEGGGVYEIPILADLLYFLSAPFTSIASMQIGVTTSILYPIYWLLISIALGYFAYQYFVNRKAEDSEHTTKTIVGYPLIIAAVTLALILCIQSMDGMARLVYMALIFLVYLFMIFFSKRKIFINTTIIGIFVGMYLLCFGFGALFEGTNGFQMIHELPNAKDVKILAINYYPIQDEDLDHTGVHKFQGLAIYDDPQLIEEAVQLQSYMLNSAREPIDENAPDMYGYIEFEYQEKENTPMMARKYRISNSDTNEKYLSFLEKMIQESENGSTKVEISEGGMMVMD